MKEVNPAPNGAGCQDSFFIRYLVLIVSANDYAHDFEVEHDEHPKLKKIVSSQKPGETSGDRRIRLVFVSNGNISVFP